HQVQRGQVAAGVVQVHVLRARVRRGDPTGLRARVPVVDRVVVLQTGVGAFPRRPRHLLEQLTGVDLFDDLAGGAGPQAELAARLHRAHELVGDAHRVVGVLVLHRRDVRATQVHVEPGVPQGLDLQLLAGLGLDELLDVRVVDVQHHHLGGPSGRATRLDGPRGRVRATHEGDRAGRGTAGAEQLTRRPDPGQVQASAGAALEDQALFLVPVEDRLHVVVDREDEAGADLLLRRRADVE